MKTFKAAIIGCGAIHSLHAGAIATHPAVQLQAVVDIDPYKAEKSAQQFNCRYYTDYQQLLDQEEIDVVHICTPHYLHASMAIQAMRAGKHVLLEKPMAITVPDAEKIIEVSRMTGKRVGVCFQNRYNPTNRRIKALLASGEVGQILGARAFVTWKRDAAYYASGAWRGTWSQEGGGVLINQSIHTLDLLYWFLGKPKKLKASIDNRSLQNAIEVEDTAEGTLLYENDAVALFYATNAYCTDSPIRLELVCEKANICLDSELSILYQDGQVEHVVDGDPVSGKKSVWGAGHTLLIHDFYDHLLSGEPFPLDGEEGIHAVRLVQAFYKSHADKDYILF